MKRALVLAVVISAGCSAERRTTSSQHLLERAQVAMGSELRLTAWTTDASAAEAAFTEVFAAFDRLDALMSVWKPGSEIERLNRAAGDHPVPIGPDVRAALEAARQVSEWTGGEFDVTFGVLSGLWKFDHDQDNSLPDMAAVKRLLPLIDYRALTVDAAAGTAFLQKKGMRAHLGGIGKGYAVDRGVEIMRRRGIRDFMIQAGGDIFVSGLKEGRPWRLGIQDPRGPAGTSFATLDLTDATFSTSGDYERFFVKNGRRYHHIIDPATGEPSQSGCRSVTIVARTATLADGLSTGVFLLGPEKGMALLARLKDVEGVIVTSANQVLATNGLKDRLVLRAPPTDAPF